MKCLIYSEHIYSIIYYSGKKNNQIFISVYTGCGLNKPVMF